MDNQDTHTKKRGFAALSPERLREIASLGGKTAHKLGKAHEFNSEEAKAAGRKGGQTQAQKPGYMQMLGSLGGKATHSKKTKTGGEVAE